MDIRNWLIEWFLKNTSLTRNQIETKTSDNYFDKGWIDSFKFISLVSDIETIFNINFLNDDFQDRSFSSIEGLALIIKRRTNG
ncbi:hypothetical protein HY988_04985 [Candidatus Micrarchaeota archaeon]|nr:hypothetical protein [Candidatus Micrarchaeota archaeon]